MRAQKLIAFAKLSRPHFLVGGFVLFALGATQAQSRSVGRYLAAQAMVSAAQLTAHYVNEHADVVADRQVANRTMFSGGSGVLASGQLQPQTALKAAAFTSATTIALAAFVAVDSLAAAALGLLALFGSWAYSLWLMRRGWGEIATSIIVVALVPIIGVLSQGGTVTPFLWWSVAVLLSVHMAMMLAFELPDLESDASVGKFVLAVRIGETHTIRLLRALLLTGATTLLVGWATGSIPSGTAIAVAALAGLPAVAMGALASSRHHGWLTLAAVSTLGLSAFGLAVGA